MDSNPDQKWIKAFTHKLDYFNLDYGPSVNEAIHMYMLQACSGKHACMQ